MSTPSSRREHRERQNNAQTKHDAPRPRRRRIWPWILVSVLVVLIVIGVVGAIIGKHVYDSAAKARTHLAAAMTDVQQVQKSILAGDLDAASKGADAASQQTAAAVAATKDWQWRFGEKLPIVGQNLVAVRTVAQVTDGLANDVVKPAASVRLSDFTFTDGAINVAAITNLSKTFTTVDAGIDKALAGLKKVDRATLIGPVADGVSKLETELKKVGPTMSTAQEVLSVLPSALGANGAKDYVLMFQGNSEARSLGGNAAQFLPVHVENGKIVRGTVVSSSDFTHQPRPEPVVPLDPQAVNIFGDKIGRYSPDFTMVPNFPTAVQILHGWWASDIHTDFQGVLSIDPVALSYVLEATGPVTLATGDQLTSQNAVSLLLNEVYFRYPQSKDQDAFFASAADSIFTKVTAGEASPVKLIQALFRAADEGRLLYQSDDPQQTKLIDNSRMSGIMPTSNAEQTAVGVYLNDNTGSKKSYYLDMAIDACRADGGAVSGHATLTSTLTQDKANELPNYIKGPYFAAEDISSYVVVYGPVGSELTGITIDGNPASPLSQGEHLGRPAVKVEVVNHLTDTHTIAFSFKTAKTEGPLAIWTTPMSRATPAKVDPTCQ
ncbi:DUF4012 domain-containing protein [Microbacterium azadirachtae]|uniref:DUF4012 domain-containing protein n=1 Tax=Microbacterium azadirachtae TaxID=582680 RepID=A0A0F0KZN6_9MICO|nr:DUF4012 domain-containing protein [Microbacterium azadirachtae]KJL26333.1 hypothetical protein RL72_01049 [Microbacterium azadirachtae]UXW85240.1 DUF4012 domain-containing protein [Microbacterium azadirachtae]